jgi:hypothetical protein
LQLITSLDPSESNWIPWRKWLISILDILPVLSLSTLSLLKQQYASCPSWNAEKGWVSKDDFEKVGLWFEMIAGGAGAREKKDAVFGEVFFFLLILIVFTPMSFKSVTL